jgi:hypothetical protein
MSRLTFERNGGKLFVGPNIHPLQRDVNLIRNPEILIRDTGFSLFPEEKYAFDFKEPNAIKVQADLKELGVETGVLVDMPGYW